MKSRRAPKVIGRPVPAIAEVRLVSDLRIMHAKVDELYQVVNALRARHSENEIVRYAEPEVLSQDIERVDHIYLWFLKLKEPL